ncbi:MAG: AAA family ATPase [Opitutaceae bacterium]|nr:AAA family ATPase [Opitutaceae bacterium]
MNLIFIHGPAASGKLTTGRALHRLTGYRLFHNHLVVDTLLAVFPFGSEPFVRLREAMWLAVFEAAAKEGTDLIFTFAPESTVSPGFIDAALATVAAAGGQIRFVELVCPVHVLEERMENPSRAEFKKLRSVSLFREIRQGTSFHYPALPPGLQIDTQHSSAEESARRILAHYGLPVNEQSV